MSDKDKDVLTWQADQRTGAPVQLESLNEQAKNKVSMMIRRGDLANSDLPMRGRWFPYIRKDDPQHMQYRVVRDAHVEILELHEETQLARYIEICDLVAKGTAMISYEEKEFVQKTGNWKILIRWLELWIEPPKDEMFGR